MLSKGASPDCDNPSDHQAVAVETLEAKLITPYLGFSQEGAPFYDRHG